MSVVVLAGGLSAERDVSLRSGRRLAEALRAEGVEVLVMDLDASAAGGSRLSRSLWSSYDPHSTGRKARTCASCHASPRATGPGTRVGQRSLDAKELARVAAVGPCLPCHAKASDPVWRDFASSRERLARGGSTCTFRGRGGPGSSVL